MNKSYRLIYNEITNTWVAVSETAKGRGKRASGAVLLAAASIVLALSCATTSAAPPNPPAPTQLPTGGQVVAGQAGMVQNAATLNISQTTNRAAIDWNTFNVGSQAQVNFNQPGVGSVTLNRVLDANPSQIYGRITAPGQVFFSNPNGMYFAPGASVDVGALVATTHGISNADFMAGNYVFSRNGASASIINEGQLTAGLNGYIALLAPEVRNSGVIVAQLGTVALAAGETYSLDFDGSRLANVHVAPATIAALVENRSAVLAPGGLIILTAQAADSLQGGVVNNAGQLEASALVNHGGTIRLAASDRIEQSGGISANGGGKVTLTASGGDGQSAIILQSGNILARSQDATAAGQIALAADRAIVQTGTLDASGQNGGSIRIATQNLVDSGSTLASGSQQGGSIDVAAQGTVMQTASARMNADGGEQGGQLRLTAGSSAWLSGNLSAQGVAGGQGGDIALSAPSLTLAGATVSAAADAAGGRIRIGGGFHGQEADLSNALSTTVSASQIDVSSRLKGSAGTAVVWSEQRTELDSQIAARGGAQGGDGGMVEVSSRDMLAYLGNTDASAVQGRAGQLLLDPKNLDISAVSLLKVTGLVDPSPTAGEQFGVFAPIELKNGGTSLNRIVVASPNDSALASKSGAVYLYNSLTGALISTLTGSQANDSVASGGITTLANGNFLVFSPLWANGAATKAGALTWANGSNGVSGTVSAANSLVGSQVNDSVASGGITTLANGNYLVRSSGWANGAATNAGALTWGSGTSGVSGSVSAANSLVGSQTNDSVASGDITTLANGNYLVRSSGWANGAATKAGAVSWGNGTSGVSGTVSVANSLVGSQAGDAVGARGVTATGNGVQALGDGNYVVSSSNWANGSATKAGAVTWVSGTGAVSGTVSTANSLVGSQAGDYVGNSGVKELTNGNYVVATQFWSNGGATNAGAVTWVNGGGGLIGTVSTANSLVGGQAGDKVGTVTALANGNYVVSSSNWANGTATNAGAVTWGNGTTGAIGTVSAANSLVGSQANDTVSGTAGSTITALSNGNYVVVSSAWANGAATKAGALTWGNGTTGVIGTVSAANSLVGSNANDRVGSSNITELASGNYVVSSQNWANGTATKAGAVTWGNGTSGVSGTLSAANSLVGSHANDGVGSAGGSFNTLSNGNYLVFSPTWANGIATNAGALTWGSGTSGVSGTISTANSVVGTSYNQSLGFKVLSNGNYVVSSTSLSLTSVVYAGAVAWANGMTGLKGTLDRSNALVGSHDRDFVGTVIALANGNYVVLASAWANGTATSAGAVTWVNGTTGMTGTINSSNSLVGSRAGDSVGAGGLTELSNGNYVVNSPNWNNGAATKAGAVTWVSGTGAVSGTVSVANSLVGSQANDSVGSMGITTLANGNYVVSSPKWAYGPRASAGAVTLGSASSGVSGAVSGWNSLAGEQAGQSVGSGGVASLADGRAVVRSPAWDTNLGHVDIIDFDNNTYSTLPQTYSVTPSGTSTLPKFTLQTQLNNGTAVVLQAHNDITLSNALNIVGFGGVTPGTLTLQAGRSVLLNASISTSNGNLNLIANDKAANGVVDANRDAGVAQMTQAAGTTINAGTGSVSIDLRDGAGLTNHTVGTVTLANINAGSLSVQSPVFTASASAVSKTYDTTTTAAMTSPSVSGLALQTGSNLSLGNPAGNFADKNVGTNKTVTSDAFVLVGFNGAATSKPQAAGADLIATTTANIGVKAIQVAGLSAQDKVYDASADTTLSGSASLTGILGSDSVSIGGGTPTSGTFSDKNVGASKSVSASIAGINLAGADAGNYQVTDFASSFAASISKADLTVAGLAAQDKVYDASTKASLSGTLAGVFSGDSVSINGGAPIIGAFSDKNVGTKKAVSAPLSSVQLTGADAENYQVTGFSSSATASISKANLTVAGLAAQNKVYDASTKASLTGTALLVGAFSSDAVSVDPSTPMTGTFSDKNVGTNKTVSAFPSGLSLTGADAGNYQVTGLASPLAASISKANLTVAGLVADDKIFDGKSDATITNWGSLSGLVGGETLVLNHGTAIFVDASVGQGKTVTATGYSLVDGPGGGLASNYQIAPNAAMTTASINLAYTPVQPPAPPAALPDSAPPIQTQPATSTPPTGRSESGSAQGAGVSVAMVRQPLGQQGGVVEVSVPREMAAAGSGFSFTLPSQALGSAGGNAAVEVTTVAGGALPSWLRFDPETRTFVATTVPDGAFPIQLLVTVDSQKTIIVISARQQ